MLSNDSGSADIVAAIERNIQNRAVETPGAANFITSYDDRDYVMLHSIGAPMPSSSMRSWWRRRRAT